MERTLTLVGIVWLALLAPVLAANKPGPQTKTPQSGVPPLAVGSPITRGNLTVFPVYSPERRKSSSDYLTLDEALKQKLIAVKEMPSAEVNRVSVTNKASKPIYLMAGDIILGGQQDCEIGRDTIVARGATDFPVEVFCVEHGRWDGGSHFIAGEIASASLRRETQQSMQQQKVWDKVAQEVSDARAPTPSGTYRAVAGRDTAQKESQASVKALGDPLAKDRRAIGLVVAINGKVTAADLFADHALFEKQLPKVLKSYALDAMGQKDAWAKLTRKPKPTASEALTLLRDAERGELRTAARSAATINRQRENNSTVLFDAAPAPPAGLGGLGGGFGGYGGPAAHRNIYRK